METVGYCLIKKNATTGVGTNVNSFLGEMCRVMEFDRQGGVLAINPQGNAMAMFDKIDIVSSFKCGTIDNVITPPGLDMLARSAYMMKVHSREGGYNDLLRRMVIAASLNKGTFNDDFLFQVQREKDAAKKQQTA